MVRMVLRRVHILARVLLLPLAVSLGHRGLHGLHGRHVLAMLHLPLAFAHRIAMVHPLLVRQALPPYPITATINTATAEATAAATRL